MQLFVFYMHYPTEADTCPLENRTRAERTCIWSMEKSSTLTSVSGTHLTTRSSAICQYERPLDSSRDGVDFLRLCGRLTTTEPRYILKNGREQLHASAMWPIATLTPRTCTRSPYIAIGSRKENGAGDRPMPRTDTRMPSSMPNRGHDRSTRARMA
ncbi:hypothetical protein KL938_003909 [Ogataea parapolymorpha]|nr:hypothetical protein KL938_003909 [Ogataea parapolymorpha]